jgi:hypothetical protein
VTGRSISFDRAFSTVLAIFFSAVGVGALAFALAAVAVEVADSAYASATGSEAGVALTRGEVGFVVVTGLVAFCAGGAVLARRFTRRMCDHRLSFHRGLVVAAACLVTGVLTAATPSLWHATWPERALWIAVSLALFAIPIELLRRLAEQDVPVAGA